MTAVRFTGTVTTVERQIKGRWKMGGQIGLAPANKIDYETRKRVLVLARAGKMNDRVIAKEIGISRRSVCRIRSANNIPAFVLHPAKDPAREFMVYSEAHNSACRESQEEAYDLIVSGVCDRAIARQLNMDHTVVRTIRVRNNISPHWPPTIVPNDLLAEKFRGKLSCAAIQRKYGIGTTAFHKYTSKYIKALGRLYKHNVAPGKVFSESEVQHLVWQARFAVWKRSA